MTDSEKIKALADWFDLYDQHFPDGQIKGFEVQEDLRRIAELLSAQSREIEELKTTNTKLLERQAGNGAEIFRLEKQITDLKAEEKAREAVLKIKEGNSAIMLANQRELITQVLEKHYGAGNAMSEAVHQIQKIITLPT